MVTIAKSDTHVVIIIPIKEAMPLGALLDACMDTVGNIEARDIGITQRQITRAEDNMQTLANELQE